MAREEVLEVLRKFSSASQQVNRKELGTAIGKIGRETILKAIPDVVHSNNASTLVRLLLEGITCEESRNSLLLRAMQSILNELCDSEGLPEASAMAITHVMSLKSHQLNGNDLAVLVQHCLKFIQSGKNIQGKWLSLFPMLFSELSKQSRVTIDGETMSGPEYCNEIISVLCNSTVETEDAVAFAAILRELKIPSNSISRFVEKLCSIIPNMEPQEVPPLVYQLLFLCDQSDYLAPLQHLATYFQEKLSRCREVAPARSQSQRPSQSQRSAIDHDRIETGSLREILQAKATSIYHVSHAASTGHPLGKEFIKFVNQRVKTPELVLVPFVLEVALSLCGLPQLREMIDLLRKAIMNGLSANDKKRHSAWMREMVSGKDINVQDLLSSVMQQCTCEWDSTFKGIELLAFNLLEIKSPGVFGRSGTSNGAGTSTAAGGVPAPAGANIGTVYQQCWSLGSHILLQMVNKFPDTAQSIVQKLVERLQDISNDAQYIDTISLLVQRNPPSMLDCKSSFTSLLYSMDYRSVSSAKRLYAGVSPLFKSSGALRDSAFLVLKKLLHSCSEDARQVAVVCFLQILKNFRFYVSAPSQSMSQHSMSSSQATVDLHHNQSASVNRAFCNDLIKLLQCSLNQQSIVRLTLYQNLPEVVSRNPELLPECVKMLRNHLKFFLSPDCGIEIPMCISKDGVSAHVVEPLSHLIQAILQVIMRGGHDYLVKDDIDGNSEDQVDKGIVMLKKIATCVARCPLQDFPLGDGHDSIESLLKINSLSSVCTALVDFCIAHNGTSCKNTAKILISIFEKHVALEELLKESAGGKGKGAKGKGTKKKKDDTNKDDSNSNEAAAPKAAKKPPMESCTLSLQNIALFLSFVDESSTDATRNQEVLNLLKSAQQNNLRLWIIQSALTKYQALRTSGDIEGLSADSVAKFSGTIARALLIHIQRAKRLSDATLSTTYLCALNCLHEMMQAISAHYPAKLSRFLMTMDGVDRASMTVPLETQLPKSLKHFKDLLNHLLGGAESEELIAKAVLPIIGILTTLSDSLSNPTEATYGDLLNWTLALCRDVQCTEASTVKALFTFLVHLTTTRESNPSVYLQMAKEIRLAVGTLGEESAVAPHRGPNRFSTINEDTAAAVLGVLSAALEQLLRVADWSIFRMGIVEQRDASPAVQRSIYTRLTLVVNALIELVQTDLRNGPNSEYVLKTATAVYTIMGRVTKKQGKVISPHFEKLIKLIATHLTDNTYLFIAHLDNEKDEEKGVKRKRSNQTATKMRKSARSIPALVFALEQYSQTVLAVSKKTKTDLSFGYKPGTTRDFKIKNDRVVAALEEEEAMADQDSNAGDEETDVPATRGKGAARRARGTGRGNAAPRGEKRGRAAKKN